MPPAKSDEDDLPKVPLSWATLREAAGLFRYLWPYRVKFTLAMASLFLGSVVGLGFPLLAGSMVNAALHRLQGEAVESWLQDINYVTLGLIAVLVGQAAFAFLRSLWFIEVGERSLADLRRDAYARLIRLPMTFHASRRVGELSSRLSADLTRIHEAMIHALPHFLRQSIVLIGGLVLILATSPQLTLVMLLSVPALAVLGVVFGNRLDKLSTQAQDRLAESQVVVEETLQNIASVKGFANESFEQGRYGKALDEYVRISIRGAVFEGAFIAFILIALFGAIVFVLWYGARLVLARQMTAGDLASFMLLTVYVGNAVGTFAELYGQLRRTLGASHRVREILREAPEPSAAEGATGPRLRGEVAFDNVVFRYPSRPELLVLRGASLEARAGERVALVGPSGAGKSTLVSLLLRFYDPEAGRLLIDGRPAGEYDLHQLRSQIAMVPQDVILFGGTIADNIAYGRPGAGQDEIEAAARKANAHDFIAAFPEGYQTRVGERGVQLSGGQRQRVAIARAILRDPAILLLDEATSSLDSESERLVLEALDRLMQGRTALIIAHRLSTVRNAGRIFVLREGRVVESGSHDELMDRPEGVYRNLSLLQLGLGPEGPSWPNEATAGLPPTSG